MPADRIPTSVLVRHPCFGSLWLDDAKIVGRFVEGSFWDTSQCGSPYYPEDYGGESMLMNFPVGCIVRWA